MIDLNYIRENSLKVREKSKAKNIEINVDKVLDLDKQYREKLQEVQNLREERNKAASARDIEKGKEIKEELTGLETKLSELEKNLNDLLFQIPNPSKDDVKVGRDESENEIVKTFGEKKELNFTPKDHLELGEKLDIIDMERAAKVSGARFTYLKNEGVLLQFALYNYALETLMPEGFIPVIPPVIINTDTMQRLGYMENGGSEDMFHLRDDEKVLVGTAEHSLVPMHRDEILDSKKFPLRYVGISSAFRREAGSYGKDTRGIFRVHQFDKVEMISFVKDGEDDSEQEFLLGLEEKLFQGLEIPYRVVKMCTGDLGFPAARKYDIEAWIPSQQKYREVTSVSTLTDFQSRRLNIKYSEEGKKKYVNVLNGTAFAIGRTIIAILENYQNENGSVTIPEVLRKYMNGIDKILPKQ